MDFTPYISSLSTPFTSAPLIQKPSIPFTVMLVSPHPDDESISGSLALRLLQENGAHVVNVAATLGSKKERQKERLAELSSACELLEMELLTLSDDWKKKTQELKSLVQKYQPQLVITPHVKDVHPTHVKTSKLVTSALKGLKKTTLVAWSEYWGQQEKPNLLLEVPAEIVNLQMQAIAKHVGEVERNPFHQRLPAWMIDNVRRGAEIVGDIGGAAPSFPFGTIYRLQKVKNGKFSDVKLETPFLSSYADLAQILSDILDAASGSKTKVK